MAGIDPKVGEKALEAEDGEESLEKRQGKKQSVALIMQKCERRKRLCVYVGGGLGGLGLYGATDLGGRTFEKAPSYLAPLFFSFALLAGFSLAYAFTEFDWKSVKFQRAYPGGVERQVEVRWKPRSAEVFYKLSYLFLFLAALTLLVAAWLVWLAG